MKEPHEPIQVASVPGRSIRDAALLSRRAQAWLEKRQHAARDPIDWSKVRWIPKRKKQ